MLQGTEGDDEPASSAGNAHDSRSALTVSTQLDRPAAAVFSTRLARALGMMSTAVTRDPMGSPATIGRVCRPTPAPRSYAWTGCVDGMRDQIQAVHDQRMRMCKPAPAGSKAGAPVERLVVADGLSPGPHELVYRHSSVTGKHIHLHRLDPFDIRSSTSRRVAHRA